MFRKIVVVTPTTMLAAVAVRKSGDDSKSKEQCQVDELAHYKCKPSELPLYAPLHSYNKPRRECHSPKNSAAREALESGIRVVRTEVQSGYNAVADQKKHLDHYIDTAIAHSQSTVDYLREPQNTLQRSGAIAAGGLTGLIVAVRGGFFRKLIYTSAGAGALASVCYPHQAEQFAKDALLEARKGFAIAYNFAKGAKPGDEVEVEPINKFPRSLEDLKYLMWDLYDDAKEALFSSKKK